MQRGGVRLLQPWGCQLLCRHGEGEGKVSEAVPEPRWARSGPGRGLLGGLGAQKGVPGSYLQLAGAELLPWHRPWRCRLLPGEGLGSCTTTKKRKKSGERAGRGLAQCGAARGSVLGQHWWCWTAGKPCGGLAGAGIGAEGWRELCWGCESQPVGVRWGKGLQVWQFALRSLKFCRAELPVPVKPCKTSRLWHPELLQPELCPCKAPS